MEEVRKKYLILFLIVLFSLGLILALPTINFEAPTPLNGSTTLSPISIVANISDSGNTSSWIDFDRTLVGYWAMDYYNSTGIYDNSSYKHNATFFNGVGTSNISTGIRGSSLDFDGTNDFIRSDSLGATTNQTFNNSGQLTFSAWINPDALTAYHGIMGSQTVRFHVTSSNFILVTIYNRTGTNQLTSSTIITTGEWQHVALTYNRSSGNATVYRNGINIGSKIILNANLTQTSDAFYVGQNWGDYFNGKIDEAIVFNRTLSQSEIKALYNSQINKLNTSNFYLENGKHNYTVYSINETGYSSNSGLRDFIISSDSSNPSITFEVPTPSNTSSTSSPVTIVANISDSLDTSSFIDFDRTLLAYWAMDYYNGTGFYDNSSGDNFLIFSGGAGTNDIMAGKRGYAFDFDIDGGDQLSRNSLALGNSATFETWAYAYSYTNMPMLWNQPNPTYTSYYDLFFISNTICLNTGDSGSNPFKYPNGTNIPLTSISLNEWHHYSVVIDSTLNQALLYIDGTYLGNASYRTPANTAGLRTMYIGGPSSSYRWNGSIDEFRIYNRSLSAAEVTAAYSSKSNKFNTSAMSLADGQHNYTVYAVDEVGNFVSSGLRNFVVTSGLQCGTLSSPGVYTLTSDVSSTGTCFTVSAANVTLDCGGHSITYSTNGGSGEHGVYSNQFNSTVKNCVIIDGNTSTPINWRNGIYFYYSNYSTLFNNSVNVYNSTSLYIYGTFLNVTKNNFTSTMYEGINAYYIHNSTFANNSVTTYATNRNGFYLTYSTNVTVFKNNASSPYRGFGSSSLNNSNLSNNFFLGKTASNNAGMIISGSYNNIFVNNTGYSSGPGIFFWSYSENNTLINNTGISTGGSAGLVLYTSSGNKVINQNATGLSSGGDGISIVESNNTIIHDCVYLFGVAYAIENYAASINTTIINCSYNTEYVTGIGQLTRKWYYQAYVNYSNGTAAAGVNVSAYNSSGALQFTVLTNASGWIQKQNVTEYVNNGGTKTFYNNYSINASKSGLTTDTNVFNFTITQNKVNDFFTLTGSDSTAPTITFEEPPTPTNDSTTSTPVTVVANISDASNTSAWIDLDRSLLGYWAMDYANSTHVFDNSSYKINGTFAGGLGTGDLVTGKRGDALDFDGSDDYIDLLAPSNLNSLSYPYTVSIWANPATLSQDSIVMSIDPAGSSSDLAFGIFNTNNELLLGPPSWGYVLTGMNSYLTAGTWQHWVVIFNSTGQVDFYLDGVKRTLTSNTYFTPGGNRIGARSISAYRYFNGSLDEAMIFNRTLSETEIKALYSSQINKFNTSAISLADGQHNYTVYAIDEYGNTASSGERNFVYWSGWF